MAAAGTRFVSKAAAGVGWRIYDRQQKKLWGDAYKMMPLELLAELNGPKRPEQIETLKRRLLRS